MSNVRTDVSRACPTAKRLGARGSLHAGALSRSRSSTCAAGFAPMSQVLRRQHRAET